MRKMVLVLFVALLLMLGSSAQAGLKAHFPFDADLNSTVGGITGTPIGNPQVIGDPKIGVGAVELDGGADDPNAKAAGFHIDGVSASDPLNPGMGDWTFATWIRLDGDQFYDADQTYDRQHILSKLYAINFYTLNNGLRTFMAGAAPGGGHLAFSGGSITDGEWTHVALVIDRTANTVTQFINAVATGTGDIDPAKDVVDDRFSIGFQNPAAPSRGVVGMMDDVGVWDEALDEDALAAVMANGVPEPATMLLLSLGGVALLRKRR
jgi:hypothetical protein